MNPSRTFQSRVQLASLQSRRDEIRREIAFANRRLAILDEAVRRAEATLNECVTKAEDRLRAAIRRAA